MLSTPELPDCHSLSRSPESRVYTSDVSLRRLIAASQVGTLATIAKGGVPRQFLDPLAGYLLASREAGRADGGFEIFPLLIIMANHQLGHAVPPAVSTGVKLTGMQLDAGERFTFPARQDSAEVEIDNGVIELDLSVLSELAGKQPANATPIFPSTEDRQVFLDLWIDRDDGPIGRHRAAE